MAAQNQSTQPTEDEHPAYAVPNGAPPEGADHTTLFKNFVRDVATYAGDAVATNAVFPVSPERRRAMAYMLVYAGATNMTEIALDMIREQREEAEPCGSSDSDPDDSSDSEPDALFEGTLRRVNPDAYAALVRSGQHSEGTAPQDEASSSRLGQ